MKKEIQHGKAHRGLSRSLLRQTQFLSSTKREGRVRRIHIHIVYFLPAFMDVSGHGYPFVILISLFFFCLFLSSFGYKPASRKSSFRPEQLRKPPYEPSRVDIQFYYNFKKYTQIYRYNCPKMIKYSFYKVSTMFSYRNKTMERDFIPRAKT